MSGSHKPGVAFKGQVTVKAETSVTLVGEGFSALLSVPADDVAYFKVGQHYVVAIHPLDSGNPVGEDS